MESNFTSFAARAAAFNVWLTSIAMPQMRRAVDAGWDIEPIDFEGYNIDGWVDFEKLTDGRIDVDTAIAFDARTLCVALGIEDKDAREAIREASQYGGATEMVESAMEDEAEGDAFMLLDAAAARALAAIAARQDQYTPQK